MIGRALDAARRLAYEQLWARRVDIAAERGLVSFAFDDAPHSAALAGAAILEGFDFRATYYVSPGLLGQEVEVGRLLSESDLTRCAERGHEIASHTYSHVRCTDQGRAALIAECRRGAEALQGFAPRNFAYPYGATDFRVKRLIGSRFDSCRGISRGINAHATDLNDLKANSIGRAAGLERSLELVQANSRLRGWLIFFTHDVEETPSRFGTTPEKLEQLTAAVQRSGLRVATIRGALEELGLSQKGRLLV